MTVKKQTVASQRKEITTLKAWDVTYAKTTKARLAKLGLERVNYYHMVTELVALRTMVVPEKYRELGTDSTYFSERAEMRIKALRYAIQRMTPHAITSLVGNEVFIGSVGGVNAFRPLPNRSVEINASGSIKQLGIPRVAYQTKDNGTCVRCGKQIGMGIEHWMGGRASLAMCHVIPEAFGGSTDNKNVVLGCGECNYQAGNFIPAFVRNRLRAIMLIAPIDYNEGEGVEYPK